MGSREKNVLLLLQDRTEDYKNKIALGIRTAFGWKEFTYKGIGLLSRKLGAFLINDFKITKGDRIAILSESKPEYGACVFASVLAGTITVPLDIKLTTYELVSILNDCLPRVLIVSLAYLETALELKSKISSIEHILVMDEPAYNEQIPSIYTIPNNYEAKWRHRSTNSLAMIIYTSGTTGAPKGVEITFRNMLTQMDDLAEMYLRIFGEKRSIKLLSILPMNHLFEMTVGFSMMMNWGLTVYYTHSLKPKDILGIMQDKNINFMIVVPAFLKLLKSAIETEVKNSPPLTRFLFNAMFKISKFIPSFRIRKLLFSKIQKKFGGNFFGCISGGAPLDVSVGEFFERIGIRVYQGYGLSETSPVVSVNVDKRGVMASVGRPLKSFEAKIDPDSGELMLRGPAVMKGYHNQPEMTAEVIDSDGWLHTGDIAKIDKDGHIYITGRIKNMIVLSGGKKVFPEEVESVLEKSPMFAEVCVFGASRKDGSKEGTEDIVAVVVPKDEIIEKTADDRELETIIRHEAKILSERLAPYKRPINIIVKKDALPKTTTRKLKRQEIKKEFAAV